MIGSRPIRHGINFLLFQAGWFVCVLYPRPMATLVIAGFLAFHFLVISRDRGNELQFWAVGTALGTGLDSLWFQTGVLDDGSGNAGLAPVWLLAIWGIFMTTPCHSLAWIGQTRWLPFVLAPLAGPFAYWSASALGAVNLAEPVTSLVFIGLGWLVLFPLLLLIKRTLYPELER